MANVNRGWSCDADLLPATVSEWCWKCDVSRTGVNKILNQLFFTSKIPHAVNRKGKLSMSSFFSALKSQYKTPNPVVSPHLFTFTRLCGYWCGGGCLRTRHVPLSTQLYAMAGMVYCLSCLTRCKRTNLIFWKVPDLFCGMEVKFNSPSARTAS